ncbi:TPA: RNA-guided endonuclease TnpB family protein, partial [Enterococcus faecium]
MLQHRAYKFRIYPNQEQEILMTKTIGCSRFVYNYFLNLWNHEYTTTGKGLSYNSCSAMLPQMKRNAETIWLKEVDSIAIQSSLKNLSDAFSRFFKKQNKRPQFKSKKHPIQSYTTKNVNNSIEIRNNFVKLPKLGFVKFAKSQEPKGRILNATIRKNSSGKFFVSILCEEEIVEFPKSNSAIGIDLGITDFAILSDGQKIDNNKFTSKMAKKLKREQRKLSKRALLAKKKGVNLFEAKNYQKQKRKVARLHEKVMNQRNDFLNKLSTEIIKNHDIIGSVLMDFVAEIVLGYVDLRLSKELKKLENLKDYKVLRYRDDYRIFSNNRNDLEQIMKVLSEVLYDLNFKLNSSKTKLSDDIIIDS